MATDVELCSPDAGLRAEYRIHSTEKAALTRHNGDLPSVSEVGAHVKYLGYAPFTYIRLYGDEFAVVSDLLPQADRIAVHVTANKTQAFAYHAFPRRCFKVQRAKLH